MILDILLTLLEVVGILLLLFIGLCLIFGILFALIVMFRFFIGLGNERRDNV